MKNMFTRPEECFSRQEATSVFRERGLWGPVDIGVVRTLSDKYVVWHCCSEGKEAAISIFKEQSPENILEIQYFTAFAREDVFMLQNNFYYIDQNDELQRIDVLFDASLASAVYEIINPLHGRPPYPILSFSSSLVALRISSKAERRRLSFMQERTSVFIESDCSTNFASSERKSRGDTSSSPVRRLSIETCIALEIFRRSAPFGTVESARCCVMCL